MSPPDRASPPPAGGPAFDAAADSIGLSRIQRLRDSLDGKNAALAELIDLFLADLSLRTAAIAAALQRGDAAALALHAHALRGGAGNFGAARLDDLCERLERTGLSGVLDEARSILAGLGPEGERVRRALMAVKSKAGP